MFCVEVFNLICEFLSAGDIFSLEGVNKECNMLCKKVQKQKILHRRVTHVLSENFLEILNRYNAVLSGSTILKIINGEKWHAGDTDIYISENEDYNNLLLELYRFIKGYAGIFDFKARGYINSTLKDIKNVYEIRDRCCDTIIQVIVITKNYEEFISSFDLDFVKNYFSQNKLVVLCKHSIRTRFSTVLKKIPFPRFKKYRDRNFQIVKMKQD